MFQEFLNIAPRDDFSWSIETINDTKFRVLVFEVDGIWAILYAGFVHFFTVLEITDDVVLVNDSCKSLILSLFFIRLKMMLSKLIKSMGIRNINFL
jgi:hypothetical protein